MTAKENHNGRTCKTGSRRGNGAAHHATTVELPGEAEVYALTGNGSMRSRTMLLNGKELKLGKNDEMPEFVPVKATGSVVVAPGSCTFIVM